MPNFSLSNVACKQVSFDTHLVTLFSLIIDATIHYNIYNAQIVAFTCHMLVALYTSYLYFYRHSDHPYHRSAT